jgi:ATP synthase protein I
MANKSQEQKPNILLIGAGTMFTSMVIAGFVVGYVFDYLLGTTPWFLLACGILGFVGGARKVYYVLMQMDPQMKRFVDPDDKEKPL